MLNLDTLSLPPVPHFCGHSCSFHGGQPKSPLPVPSEFRCLVPDRCKHSCPAHGKQPVYETRTFFCIWQLTASILTTGTDGNSSVTVIELTPDPACPFEDYEIEVVDRGGNVCLIDGALSVRVTIRGDGETSVLMCALRWLGKSLRAIGFKE